MPLTGHYQASDPISSIHSFESRDYPAKPPGDHLCLEGKNVREPFQEYVAAERNNLQRVGSRELGGHPSAPDRVDSGLRCLGKRGIASEDELYPLGKHRIPEDWRLKHHIVAFEVREKVRQLHVQKTALPQDTERLH